MGIDPGGLFGGDDLRAIERFAAQTGVTFPVGADAARTYARFRPGASISPFPVDVIIRPDGRIAYLAGEYEPGAMRAVLESLFSR